MSRLRALQQKPNGLIEIVGEAKFQADLDAWFKRAELYIDSVYRVWVRAIFAHLVEETPQWTGNAAANWMLSVQPVGSYNVPTGVDYHFKENFDKNVDEPKRKGDPAAVNYAKDNGLGELRRLNTGMTAIIYNNAENMNGQAYLHFLEDNPGDRFLRPENEPGHMVERTRERFAHLGEIGRSVGQMSLFSGVA